MDRNFIDCRGLVKIYKIANLEVVALQGLDLKIKKSEMIGIIGPSGSGKTSLMNILGGLDIPSAGKVTVANKDLIRMTHHERLIYRRHTVGFVWQNVSRNLIPYLTAIENVHLPMILSGNFNPQRANHLLELVGLGKRKHHRPINMSGGEQQRVAIAIGIANNPSLLLADEPTGSLDSENTVQLIKVFNEVRIETGITTVIVTHDTAMAKKLDRYIEIHDGKTSLESVRQSTIEKDFESQVEKPKNYDSATVEPFNSDNTSTSTHQDYTLLDSAGRMQLSKKIRMDYGITDKIKLVEKEGHLIIYPIKK